MKTNLKIKIQKSKISLFALMILLGLVISPLFCRAFSLEEFLEDLEEMLSETNSTEIQNEVKVQTNTGGNVVSDGEVIQGEQKSEIHIKNVINGTEIDPVDIETQASEVKVESEIKTEDDTATVHREIEIDSEKTTENYEVDLSAESLSNNQASEEEINENQGWLSALLASIESFFKNIFNIF